VNKFFLLYYLPIVFLSCDLTQPQVVIVNKTNEHILIRNISINGCLWNTTLAYGESTSPDRCLRGEDKVHFEKFDAFEYCRNQVKDGTIDSIRWYDSLTAKIDSGLINTEPFWFNYQTISVKEIDDGGFHKYEIRLDDIEQDFSSPGPYGH
jgi:hypothetical protein